jgi:hypothetical protein
MLHYVALCCICPSKAQFIAISGILMPTDSGEFPYIPTGKGIFGEKPTISAYTYEFDEESNPNHQFQTKYVNHTPKGSLILVLVATTATDRNPLRNQTRSPICVGSPIAQGRLPHFL